MKKIAFIFPGQGAQEVGMGRDILGKDARADELMNAASALTGEDLARLCLRGPDRRLRETRHLQPALTALSITLLQHLTDAGIKPVAAAGHSVGELPACAASGTLSAAECIRLAVTRGAAMGDAAAAAPGGMIAVTGPPSHEIIAAVEQAEVNISTATVNAPSQVTVSGPMDALDKFQAQLKKTSTAKIVKLRVEGAWHSIHMERALPAFAAALKDAPFKPSIVPMFFNRDGATTNDPQHIRELLAGQLIRPVRWDLVMKSLNALGITDYIEIGPGKILRGLVRLNVGDPTIQIHNVSSLKTINSTLNALAKHGY